MTDESQNLFDPEAPYPDGCGPDCDGCDPCVCGHRWGLHGPAAGCLAPTRCACVRFDPVHKAHIIYPKATDD